MFWHFGTSKKTISKRFTPFSKGFTLLELIVVMAIFLIITGVVLVDIPNFREKSALELTVSEVATYIRGAQVYGAVQKGGTGDAVSYGIALSKGVSNFSLFKNSGSGTTTEESYKINGFQINDISIEGLEGESLCSFDFEGISIMFKVNDYSSGIGTQLEPTISVGGDSCGNFSLVKIKITPVAKNDPAKCVLVYNNGQISPATCNP